MWKKAKRFLAVLLALTLMLSVVDSEELFVSASATNVQEDTGAGGETEPAAGEETKSTDVSVEEDTAVTSVGDEGSGEVTATVPGDGTGTGTETGGAADETGTDGTETAGTGTETSGSGTEGAEGTTIPGSETPASGTEGKALILSVVPLTTAHALAVCFRIHRMSSGSKMNCISSPIQ